MAARNGAGPAIAETMAKAQKVAAGERGNRSSSQKAEPAQLFNKRTWRKLSLEALEARITEIQRYAGKGNILNLSQWKLVDRMRKRAEQLAAEGAGAASKQIVSTPATDTSLDDLAAQINAEHEAVSNALSTGLSHAIKAGRLLIEAKTQLHQHGQWLPWLATNCPEISTRSAQAYMRCAANLDDDSKAQRVAHLSFREALAGLASPARTPVDRSPSKSTGTAVVVAEPSNGKAVAVSDTSDACDYDWSNVKEADFGNPTEAYRAQAEHFRREATSLATGYPLLSNKIDAETITETEIQSVRKVAQAWTDVAEALALSKPSSTPRSVIDQANAFHRELMAFVTGFEERFTGWLKTSPEVDEHGKAELRQALLLCSEGILRLIQELDDRSAAA